MDTAAIRRKIFRWFVAGITDTDGRLLAGGGLGPDEIDDGSLEAWEDLV